MTKEYTISTSVMNGSQDDGNSLYVHIVQDVLYHAAEISAAIVSGDWTSSGEMADELGEGRTNFNSWLNAKKRRGLIGQCRIPAKNGKALVHLINRRDVLREWGK